MRILAFILIASLLSACDNCRNLDCIPPENYFGQFRLLNATTGQDLAFGPNRVYDANKIRFFSLNGTDTTFYDYKPTYFPGTGYDSILYVHFFPKTALAYMRLSNGDIDTFKLTFKSTDSRCCGMVTEIDQFNFNNTQTLPGSAGTVELKK